MADTLVPSGVLVMPDANQWPTVCGNPSCAHLACISRRKQARTLCHLCEQRIRAGAQYREYRDPLSGKLVLQEHVTCPAKVTP